MTSDGGDERKWIKRSKRDAAKQAESEAEFFRQLGADKKAAEESLADFDKNGGTSLADWVAEVRKSFAER